MIGVLRQSLPIRPVDYNGRCFWSADGGNLTTAKELCNDSGGTIFTFNTTSEASDILDALNISRDIPVFIGAIRVYSNDSSYFDWLSRPGTWPSDAVVDVTSENEQNNGTENICVELLGDTMSLTHCARFMNVTICEQDDALECYVNQDSLEPVTNSVKTGTYSALMTPDLPPTGNLSAYLNDDMNSLEQTTISEEICNSTSCITAGSMINSTPVPKNLNLSSDQWGLTANKQTTEPTEVDLGELMVIPDGNGTRITNFSTLLSEIFEKSKPNISKEVLVTTDLPSTTNMSGNYGNNSKNQHHNITHGTPVREAKFQTANTDKIFHGRVQISGINSGSVQPYSLLIDKYHHEIEELENISRILNTLKHEQQVDNNTLMVFAETVGIATGDVQITAETEQLKKDLFSDIMSVGEDLVTRFPASTAELSITTDKLVLYSRIVKPSGRRASDVSLEVDHPHTDTHIKLIKSIFEAEDNTGFRVSTIAYKKMGSFVKASNKYLTSTVVSVTVQTIQGNETKHATIRKKDAITFDMKTHVQMNKKEQKRMCTFWDFSRRKWSSSGCSVVSKNTTHTKCTCDHLTNFAILVMYVETENISLQSQQALFTLTTVGCSLSIACLAMTLICYIYLKMLTNEKIMIHANLSLALLLGQIVFVASGDAHRYAMACKVVAILLHFLFMASFTWMMVEGIALYLCCTKGIFHHRDMRVKYFLFGWGLPLIIVVISLAARFPDYGSGPQYSCWLSIDDGLIWAFLGPMLVIVVLNIGVMGLVIKCFLTLRANSEKTEAARLRGSLRAMMTLLPLLGVTWILSLLVPFSVVFHYFFVIFNTVQGMCIFFLHCICNEEIRKKFYEKRRRWSTTRTGSDAEMTFPSRRKTGSFDAIRIAATATPLPAEYASRPAWS
ncbi:adhesion G protein-coupled receptor E4-like [Ruditapes philippinarum]|uniref:adhesion G protein-coupled receptor E4-like n=1 Tax=Ruditapes philippinarum TaxID=129788 RepID=UPI00295B5DA7|nr:adhesion G protein-coupled receptor E4-like [Ruditapes philippinarum]